MAAGTFGGGTLSIRWKAEPQTAVEYPDGSLTASGGLVIAVAGRVDLVLSGATNPSISVVVTPIHKAD